MPKLPRRGRCQQHPWQAPAHALQQAEAQEATLFCCPETTQVHKFLQLLKPWMISVIISIDNEEITDITTSKKNP